MARTKQYPKADPAEIAAAARAAATRIIEARSICPNCKQDMPTHQGLPKPNPDEVMALWLAQNREWMDDQSILRGIHPGCPARGSYSHDSHGEIIRRGPANG